MKPAFPDIRTYYDHTRVDYRMVWKTGRNLAVHFGYYDDHADKHHDALSNLNRVLADRAAIQPGEAVLDAGCGVGGSCFWLAKHRGVHATGITIVPKQIEDCRAEARRLGASNVDFVEADYCATPFPDASFDVVWACESLCHTAEKLLFYKEAFRLLRPGGRLVLAEYLRIGRPVPEEGERLLAEWLRPWAIPDIDTTEEHKHNALTAGFISSEWENATPFTQVSLRNLYQVSKKSLPWGLLFNRMGFISNVRIGNVRGSIRLYEALLKGAWYYGIGICHKAL